MMITYTHNSQHHRTGFGRSGTGSELNFWRLTVTISGHISWLISRKGVELVHLYYKTCWDKDRASDYSGIGLVYNYSAEFRDSLLLNEES